MAKIKRFYSVVFITATILSIWFGNSFADTKVTAMPLLDAAAETSDLMYIIDNPSGTPTSKKITVGNVLAAVPQVITDNAILTVDDADAADGQLAMFTANGIEGVSTLGIAMYSSTSHTANAVGEFDLDTNGDGSTITQGVLGVHDGTQLGYYFPADAYPTADNQILKYNAANNKLEWESDVSGAGAETNSLETVCTGIATTEIPIGTSADTVTYAALSGDVTMANTGAVTIANNAVETAMLATDSVTMDAVDANGDFTSLTGDWKTTGYVSGQANVQTDASGGITLTVNAVNYGTDTGDADIPDGACDAAGDVGNWVVLISSAADAYSLTSNDASNQFVIAANAAALTAGNELDVDGTMVCVMCIAAELWKVTGYMGAIPTDGGAAD